MISRWTSLTPPPNVPTIDDRYSRSRRPSSTASGDADRARSADDLEQQTRRLLTELGAVNLHRRRVRRVEAALLLLPRHPPVEQLGGTALARTWARLVRTQSRSMTRVPSASRVSSAHCSTPSRGARRAPGGPRATRSSRSGAAPPGITHAEVSQNIATAELPRLAHTAGCGDRALRRDACHALWASGGLRRRSPPAARSDPESHPGTRSDPR
jgi:hypothetical protein